MTDQIAETQLKQHKVWDVPVRLFHWINVVCVLCLIAMGTALMNGGALGLTVEGKILLKTWHVYFGYVFVINLAIRILWGFIGNRYARWAAILPKGETYKPALKDYVRSLKNKQPIAYLGHNPLARIIVSAMLLLLSLQAITGLVLAGTDVYMPPFGGAIKEWVATDAAAVELVQPYSKQGIDQEDYKVMRMVRTPFITLHDIVFFSLLALIVIHIFGVIFTEIVEKNSIVSAMITGKKVFKDKPLDSD